MKKKQIIHCILFILCCYSLNAQIISGPDNVTSGTYSVPGINPYVRYDWGITGGVINSYINGGIGDVRVGANVTWNLFNPLIPRKLEVIEVPIYKTPVEDPYRTVMVPLPTGGSDDTLIQGKINEMKTYIFNNGGTGTVLFPEGDYIYKVDGIHLAEGVRLQGAINYTTTLQRYTPLVGPNPAVRDVRLCGISNYRREFSEL